MPTYEYSCDLCGEVSQRNVRVAYRRMQSCNACHAPLRLIIYAVPGKIVGKAVEGGGPDRFTADALGIPLKELPSGLRTKR
jgi:putative FmdB family regulatory protein